MSYDDRVTWSKKYINTWHDEIEGQMMWEMEEPPELKHQLANDILYGFDMEPFVLAQLIEDMVATANDTIISHLDPFLLKISHADIGAEFSSVNIEQKGNVNIVFTLIPLKTLQLMYENEPYYSKGGQYAHVY